PETHALGPLALLQLVGCYSLAGLQPLHAAPARDIQQNAASDNTVCVGRDVLEIRNSGGDFAGESSVVKPPLVGHMAERVDVRVAVAVNLPGHIVQRKTRLA